MENFGTSYLDRSQHKADLVFGEQIRLLYSGSNLTVLASLLAGVLMAWSLWGIYEARQVLIWFLPFVGISLTRLWLQFLFFWESPREQQLSRWHGYFLIGNFSAGICWGIASFLLFPLESQLHQTIFCLIIVGLAAGSISSLCPSRPAAIGFLSLLLLPLAFRVATLETEGYGVMGLLLVLFWAVVLLGDRRINHTLQDNILLKHLSFEKEEVLRESEQRYRQIFNNAPMGLYQYDANGVIVDCNEYFIDLLGSDRKKIIGFDSLAMVQEEEILAAIRASLTEGDGYFEGDYKSLTGDKLTPIRAFFRALRSPDLAVTGGVGIVEDFTDKKRFEEKIYYHASYDFLTGLPNRRLLLDKLKEEISRAKRHVHYGALLFLDLDNFKTINDSLGHSVGDELLRLLASRLKDCTRQEDVAARMGGDEFVIILTELDGSIQVAANKARMIAEDLRLCLSAPCEISGQEIHTGLSIGVSMFPQENKGVDDILKQADAAMYKAKADGRNLSRFFSPSMQEAADERLRLNTELKNAMDRKEFVLYYQPQVDSSGKIVGAEGLLRWEHPERGLLPPVAFLGVAEDAGLMPEIGQWVLTNACEQIKKWIDSGLLQEKVISVNVGGRELTEPGFVSTVERAIADSRIDPRLLGIELTEGSLVSTTPDTVAQIKALQKLGLKFSVDDFGTGYSSLNYLHRFPINTLKIDRSFVTAISSRSQKVVLVDTIIVMAKNLGLGIVAEGVENQMELDYLHLRECTTYQGFYFSPPVSAAEFTEMLVDGPPWQNRDPG